MRDALAGPLGVVLCVMGGGYAGVRITSAFEGRRDGEWRHRRDAHAFEDERLATCTHGVCPVVFAASRDRVYVGASRRMVDCVERTSVAAASS